MAMKDMLTDKYILKMYNQTKMFVSNVLNREGKGDDAFVTTDIFRAFEEVVGTSARLLDSEDTRCCA